MAATSTETPARVDLITGFLGAGKTTFIRRYCAHLKKRGLRFAVIENEYGRAGVDTAILRGEDIETGELAGGCICCTLKAGFHDMLLRLHGDGVRRIIVEPSGVYEASQFFYVMGSEQLRGKCVPGAALCIVDPLNMGIYDDERSSFLRRQLELVGGAVISRTGIAGRDAVLEAERRLRSLAPLTPVVCDKDWAELTEADFDRLMSAEPPVRSLPPTDTDHSKLFLSCTLKPAGVYDEESAAAALRSLISGGCGSVLRVKGFLAAEDGVIAINAVPGEVSAEKCRADAAPCVNVIGLGLRRGEMREILK